MFGKIRTEKEDAPLTLKSFLTRCGIVLAIMLLAFAIEKIAGTGKGVFFEVAKAISLVLYFVAYIIVGRKIVIHAFVSLFKGKIEVEPLVVTVATLICILIGQYVGSVVSMLIYYAGENLVGLRLEEKKDGE